MSLSRWHVLMANRTEKVVTCTDRFVVVEAMFNFETLSNGLSAENSGPARGYNRFAADSPQFRRPVRRLSSTSHSFRHSSSRSESPMSRWAIAVWGMKITFLSCNRNSGSPARQGSS